MVERHMTLIQATTTFDADLVIWGASLWGDSDPSVIVAEYGDNLYWHGGSLWDVSGPSGWLRSVGDNDYEPVPLYWSLPWVLEWLLQKGQA